MMNRCLGLLALALLVGSQSAAQDQTIPGAGNGAAVEIARRSRLVKTATEFLIDQAKSLSDPTLRSATLDAIGNPNTCVRHRAGVTDAVKNTILQTLTTQGLVDTSVSGTFPGGLKAGVFPPLLDDGSSCPHLPQPFFSAPGSVFHGHHSYPGGLPVHETNNDVADIHLASEYRRVYGGDKDELPLITDDVIRNSSHGSAVTIDQDIIAGAPIWHDWGKPIVFQWNADGSEFQELNFGGNGKTDAFGGAAGDSRTGGHHMISIAEAMARGLSPAFVITQASAHSNPTSGNEYKVVNWLRAAAIMAQIDPVARGYLVHDGQGNLRLPAVRELGEINFLATSPSQTNILVEYELHNLSDADFTFSGPAVSMVETVLAQLAPEFGFNPANVASYNLHFRNPAFSSLSAERLQIIYASHGVDGVRRQLRELHEEGII